MPDNQSDDNRPVLRDARGRLLPGSATLPGAGRPKGSGGLPNMRTMIAQVAEAEGVTPEDAVAAVVRRVLQQAVNGDTKAAKLILDRMPSDESEAAGGATGWAEGDGWVDGEAWAEGTPWEITPFGPKACGVGPQMPVGRRLVLYVRELARIADSVNDAQGAADYGFFARDYEAALDAAGVPPLPPGSTWHKPSDEAAAQQPRDKAAAQQPSGEAAELAAILS